MFQCPVSRILITVVIFSSFFKFCQILNSDEYGKAGSKACTILFDSISAISVINYIDPAQVDMQFMDIILMRFSILLQ